MSEPAATDAPPTEVKTKKLPTAAEVAKKKLARGRQLWDSTNSISDAAKPKGYSPGTETSQ